MKPVGLVLWFYTVSARVVKHWLKTPADLILYKNYKQWYNSKV